MTHIDLNSLKPLLQADIPVFQVPPPNYFQISGFPHYENVITNWYAFFFDTNGEHGFQDLFINSLIGCLNKKGKAIASFNGCKAEREVSTKKGGRLDLLLRDMGSDALILVENKIYHFAKNDFADYYDSFEGERIGVLLTLHVTASDNQNFVNITHKELLEEISMNLGSYWMQVPERYIIALKEFISNIDTFYPSPIMKESIDFFLQNVHSISQIVNLNNNILDHILKNIRSLSNKLDYLMSGRSDKYRYLILNNGINYFYYAISFEGIFKRESDVVVILEFGRIPDEQLKRIIDAGFHLEYKDTGLLFNIERKQGQNYIHYAYKVYKIDGEKLSNLDVFLYEVIQKDFEGLKDMVVDIVKK